MSMGFLNGLLNDGKLKKEEFDVAAKYVADRYDIEAVEYELAKLRYPNLQTKESVVCKESIPEPAVEKAKELYVSLTDIAKKNSGWPIQALSEYQQGLVKMAVRTHTSCWLRNL